MMHSRVLLAAVVVLALAGCAQSAPAAQPGGDPEPSTVDVRGEWTLTDASTADGTVDTPDFPLTVVFTEGSARVRTGCFAYDLPMGQKLDVQTASLANPRADCMAMSPELDAATQQLGDVTDAVRDGDRLVLTGPDLEFDFALVPAVASADLDGSWTLSTILMSDTAMAVNNGPTFDYADGAVSGTLHCDNFTGTLDPVSGNNVIADLSIEPSGDVCTTEERPEVNELTALLKGTFVVHRSDESLELISPTEDKRFIFLATA